MTEPARSHTPAPAPDGYHWAIGSPLYYGSICTLVLTPDGDPATWLGDADFDMMSFSARSADIERPGQIRRASRRILRDFADHHRRQQWLRDVRLGVSDANTTRTRPGRERR